MSIIEQLEWRYATKKFDSEALIPDRTIALLKDAFNLTATSYGLQPIKLVLIKDKALQKDLVKHSMNQEQVAQASHVLVFCIETNIDKEFIETYFDRVQQIRNTSDDILQPFEDFLVEDFGKKTTDHIEAWATNQAYLAMGNLLTVCAIERVDSCPMEGFSPQDYDKVLGLKEKGLKSVLVMPIGYRAKDDMFATFKKVRKTVAESTLEL